MTAEKVSAVLFDLDGTLVDSLRDIGESMNAVLAARKMSTHPLDAYRSFVGDGMARLAERALPEDLRGDAGLARNLVEEMREEYARRWRTHATPYPGVPEMLLNLAEAGFRLGVLSNKPEAFTREMVDFVFPDIAWSAVRGAREGVPVKPSPEAPREMLRVWGLEPEETLYVGDTDTDMLTARNVGMPSAGVAWGFRDRAELEAAGATHVVDHPAQIPPLAKKR